MALDIQSLKEAPEKILELSSNEQYSIPYRDVAEIQLAGAARRFAELVDRIPMLSRLAEEQGTRQIGRIEELAPLLMLHSAYKSYPLSILESGKFDRLARWLNGLTSFDLSGLDASHCETIDEWVQLLNRETQIRPIHSTGTTGKLSFIPRSVAELAHSAHGQRRLLEAFGDEEPALGAPLSEAIIIVPNYRRGAAILHRYLDVIEEHLLMGDSSRLIALNPGYLSADLLSLGGRLRAAENKGELGQIQLSPKLLERREAFLKDQQDAPQRLEAFLDRLESLRGSCIWVVGGHPPQLYSTAMAGLKRGMKNMFRPDSYITGGGGAKGTVLPEDWQDMAKSFWGAEKFKPSYGMSEMTVVSRICPQGHYHVPPWQIPFVLDPGNGSQYPRTGTHTGRFGVFDLNAFTYWGGFLTGDEITLSWGDTEPCACGRIGPYVHRTIRRYTEKEGGDDKITCAGTPGAHDAALDYLLASIG